ncbi:MAG: DUF115 domain-containing protein [Desulfobacteraceae bacterium]|nr:DUF115 domain-containing protein [Desulfobacteraceae bacterium]MBC2750814.1 DUF115 domain-containing protein [Desulfobacteraceae bacterium]
MKPTFLPEIFEKNMVQLKARFPEIADQLLGRDADVPFPLQAFATPYGQVNISVTLPDGNKVSFYEEGDIVGGLRAKMADWQLEAEDFLFCVGIGLGYMPLLACRQFAAKPHIVVIEPNPEILCLALRSVDLRPLLAYERLDLYLGPNLPVSDIVAKYGERLFFGKNRLVSHGPSRLLYQEKFKSLENDVVENIRIARNIGYTAKHAGKMIFANTMKNLSSLFSGPDLRSLEGRFKGCPAICVAAGPSLDKDLACLKAVGNRALIVCADSAVRSLVNEGIRPHMVVTTDMNPVNFEKLRTSLDRLRESALVFSIEANPDNVGKFLGQRRIAVTSKNAILNEWLGPKWSLDWQLPAMTSVSHTALFTAMALGAAPIILVGMDFAYSSGKSHASGSVFRYPANIDEAIQVDGVRGYPVHSLPQLITDRKQIENAMAGSTVRFVDTSLDGALIQGAENRSLKEVLDTELQTETDVSSVLESIDWSPSVPAKAVITEFEEMVATVNRFISTCHASAESCRFSHSTPAERTDGRRYAQRAARIRQELAAFEKKNGKLLSLLKLIRYGDVKEISRRLDAIQTSGEAMNDRKLRSVKELEVYADHFASLERAARFFQEALVPVNRFFIGEAQCIRNIDRGPVAADQILLLGDYYRKHDVIWQAEQAFLRYIEKRPDDSKAWLDLGRMFAEKGLWLPAQVHARQMKRRFPADRKIVEFESEIARGILDLRNSIAAFLDTGAIEEARQKLYEYLSLGSDDTFSQAFRERINAHDQANTRAMIQPEAIQLPAVQKQALNERVLDCLEIGAAEKAIGILEGLAQEKDANAWAAREQIGDIRLSQGDVSSAVWHYRQALAFSAGNRVLASKIQWALQQAAQGMPQGKKKMTAKKKDQRRGPQPALETPDAMYRQAQTKIEQEAYPEAIHVLEQLLVSYPDVAIAHNDLGVLYYNQGNTQISFSHYKEAVRIEPQNPVFQKNLADFYYIVRGEVQSALEIYVDLLSKDPQDKETLLALGHICTEQEKFDDAAVFYRRVLEIDPLNIDADRGLNALPGRQDHGAKEPSINC